MHLLFLKDDTPDKRRFHSASSVKGKIGTSSSRVAEP